MGNGPIPSAALLRQLVDYDPETGQLTRLVTKGGKAIGSKVGCAGPNGYLIANVAGYQFYVHRLIYLWMTGENPAHQIDHINGDRSDNRWINLRNATAAENQQNRKRSKNNTSGYLGVSPFADRWQAHIKVNRKSIFLGLFHDPKEAAAAYARAKGEMHNFNPIIRSTDQGHGVMK